MSGILDDLDAGRIKVLLLFGTNMISSFADASRVSRALDRMDLVVSHDLFMQDTARNLRSTLSCRARRGSRRPASR
jgi:predicted molibdopterin-dependent oxidoreductase YjgC